MFKVVWKSFKYNRKNFLSFFMSEILSVAVIFMLIYIQEALSQVPGIKTEALQFAYQSELRKQLRIIIPCIILIMILVTGYSVKAYINTRIWDYKLFQLLGIRKKNLKVMIGLEYVISGMLACGFGILFGLIGTKIIKEILHTRINARFVKGISMSRVYLVLILSCLIMTIGVYITLQILLDTRTNLGDKIFKIKESRIHSMISVIYFIVGILVISSGYLLVNNDPMMAYMALICILTGLIILMIFGTGFFMEKFSESKYYKKHILAWNDCYCYIKKHGFRMLMQILLGIILIFNTFLMLRGTIHDRYMPNDFVCIGNSKETTAVNTVVTARFNGLTKQFPFLWFNEMRGDSWVAISLSDYNKIYNKNESLNKNEIIRIWRKEGSRKSDLSDKQHRKIKSIALIIGVALQIYLLFPWIQHYTIYGYLYNVLKMNDYVQMYNETILPSLRESWNYTKMTAFVFLVIIILIALFQLTELARIYHILKNEQSSDYRGFFWIIYLAIFSRFFEKFAYVDPIDNSLIPIYVEIYICVLLAFIGLWILIDAMLDTWEAEHISATEYKRLTGKQVHLKNDEIYVIYQWDRSEYGTIGLDFGKLKPRLYTGCATADIWIYTARTLPGNKFTRKYTIKGNDRRIITGNFKTRVLSTSNMNTDVFEDIIVFSDHEYDKISQKAKGSNLTVLMNVAQNYDAVVNKIANYAAKHSQINFFDYHDGNLIYDKKQCTIEDQENRMLNVSAMLIDMLVLFISIIFILLEKISSDYEALEWKYLFYYRTGMPEKKRRKNIYKEITMTSKVALITGMFIAAVMILVKILYKKMPVYWTKIYLAEAAVMIIGMTAIIMIIVRIAAWRSFKRSERRNKDE